MAKILTQNKRCVVETNNLTSITVNLGRKGWELNYNTVSGSSGILGLWTNKEIANRVLKELMTAKDGYEIEKTDSTEEMIRQLPDEI